jgi:hypothetical protein
MILLRARVVLMLIGAYTNQFLNYEYVVVLLSFVPRGYGSKWYIKLLELCIPTFPLFLDIHVLRMWTLEAPLCYFLKKIVVFDNLFELCSSWIILIWYSLMCILQYWDLMSHLQLVWDMWVYCGNLLVSLKSWDLYGLYTFDYPRLLRHLSRG